MVKEQGREPVNILGERATKSSSVQAWTRQDAWQHKLQSAAWRNWKRCSGVLCDRRTQVKVQTEGKDLQNCGQTSSVVW